MSRLKRWLPLAALIGFVAIAWGTGLVDLVNLETIKAQSQSLQHLVAAHPILSLAGYVVLYATATALSLPIATLLTLVGGFLFGRWLGTAAIVVGATSGATILFLIARGSAGRDLREKAGPLYQKIAAKLDHNLIGYMLFMRLVPLFPFFLVNIVPALFNVRLLPYMLTTFFGIIPITFVYANFGQQLGTIESLADLASPQMLLAFTLLGFAVLIPSLYKRRGTGQLSAIFLPLALALLSQPVLANDSYHRFLALYDGMLKTYTHLSQKDGISYNGVDYDAWEADSRHKEALSLILSENPAAHETPDEQKAFWINAYNFLTIDLIVREGERETIKNLGGVFSSPWKRHTWPLAGRDYSLDDIEHKILRPMGDPRIHFAINCASVSCPDLRPEPYRAESLNAQLDDQTKMTLSNPAKGVRISDKSIYVSKIFDWFGDDFDNGKVRAWLSARIPLEDTLALTYLDYDWSLNEVARQ
ncbi:MAG: DUF547 domain-containing protein [Bdellovibrionales bacterium]